MSATRLKIRGMEFEAGLPFEVPEVHQGLFVRLGVRPGPEQKRCPHCEAVVYSRRHAECGVCGAELPVECRFTPEEAQRVEELVRRERTRHRAWLRKNSPE